MGAQIYMFLKNDRDISRVDKYISLSEIEGLITLSFYYKFFDAFIKILQS
jgi:hypothetical protein